MYDKSNLRIILLEIFDKDYEEECISYRRSVEDDYDDYGEIVDEEEVNEVIDNVDENYLDNN